MNYGLSFTQKFDGKNVEGNATVDFCRTQFQNQIFPDYDTDPTKAIIGNFTGTQYQTDFRQKYMQSFLAGLKSNQHITIWMYTV